MDDTLIYHRDVDLHIETPSSGAPGQNRDQKWRVPWCLKKKSNSKGMLLLLFFFDLCISEFGHRTTSWTWIACP